jgi:hypothetical protein
VPRLLVLCRQPYHLHRQEAQGWLRQEIEEVLRRDELPAARLTRLGSLSAGWESGFDWLLEFRVEAGGMSTATEPSGAFCELVADLRLLGMAPAVVLADDRGAVELHRP